MRTDENTEKKAARSGFTLIELLIVIGVLVVLVAILIPSFNRVRAQAQAALCASNVRQIVMSSISYATDNNGSLFYAPLCGTTQYNSSAATFSTPSGEKPMPFLMDGSQPMGLINYNDVTTPGLGNGVLWPYIGPSPKARQSVFTCPSDTNEHPTMGRVLQMSLSRNFSYSFNFCLNNKLISYAHGCLRISQVIAPSHKILVFEEVGPNDGACFWTGDVDDFPSQRHMTFGKAISDDQYNAQGTVQLYTNGRNGNGCANLGFCDGHVECLLPQIFWGQSYYGELTAK